MSTSTRSLLLALLLLAAQAAHAAGVSARDNDGGDGDEGQTQGNGEADAFGQTDTVTFIRNMPLSNFGERLFKETRFAQFFKANCNGDVNATLSAGDPVVAAIQKADGTSFAPGPFAGQAINCRSCHLIAEAETFPGGTRRTYADFARRSPIPFRGDGLTLTARNAPSLANATLTKPNMRVLHFDGEFTSITGLVKGTLTGRNYGWLPTEHDEAVQHIANVIRKDNGNGGLGVSSGGPYYLCFMGQANSSAFVIPKQYQIDVRKATDDQIFEAIATIVAGYVHGIQLSQDAKGLFNGSPYDIFLLKNKLPRKPRGAETDRDYGRRLLADLEKLSNPRYVTPADGKFQTHTQPFQFGPTELQGLKIFLSEPGSAPVSSVGNCLACHAPPRFTDFNFHNTGVSQEEYDAAHGSGAFLALLIPSLTERNANYNAFLPPTAAHPSATGAFRSIPSAANPNLADLGVWNMFANPDHPDIQVQLTRVITGVKKPNPNPDLSLLLDQAIGRFKTPGIRDLSDSGPYFHNGSRTAREDVVQFYIQFAALARQGAVRNADPELSNIELTDADIAPLAAFLLALDEDYPD